MTYAQFIADPTLRDYAGLGIDFIIALICYAWCFLDDIGVWVKHKFLRSEK